MSKLISIIIPYYKETDCELFPLFHSISCQVGVDYSRVECLLVNDGANNVLAPDFLAIFKTLEIRCIMLPENRGPGIARQAGIDAATGDYLLFCDADDQLYDGSVLSMFMLEAEKGADIIAAQWMEERINSQNEAYFVPRANEATWMHGKLIRRQYLIDNDIRFHPELRIHEDSYFLALAYAMTDRVQRVDAVTYIWKYNENSITRSNGAAYSYTSHETFLHAIGKSLSVLAERAPSVMPYKVIQFMLCNYFIMQEPDWQRPPATRYREPAERAFRDTITPYLEYYRTADPEYIDRIFIEERARRSADGFGIKAFHSWLDRVLGAAAYNRRDCQEAWEAPMGKRISIIIPYYRETQRDIFPLLSSIRNQVGFDFTTVECLLVNDGANNELEPEFLALFEPLECRCILLNENRGPGVARQAGIDAAAGDYLLFCDADDQLHNCSVLLMFMNEIENQPDIVATEWLEELIEPQSGKYGYIEHKNDVTWMHGKLIRRNYLLENNIRFHPELRIDEDTYFIPLVYAMTDHILQVAMTTYVRRYNKNSITRSRVALDSHTSHMEFIDIIGKCFAVLAEKAPNAMYYRVIQFMLLNYFTLQQPFWQQPSADEYREPTERAFGMMIMPYLDYYRTASPDFIEILYNEERAKYLAGGKEKETFDSWVDRVTASP